MTTNTPRRVAVRLFARDLAPPFLQVIVTMIRGLCRPALDGFRGDRGG